MKRCILYFPYGLTENAAGARVMRTRNMIKAFKEIGYDVFAIYGYSWERKKLIKQLKKNIANGIQYDFLYNEHTAIPTLLTDPDHLPRHPFMDFGFFRYIRKQNIKIGLFYCDVFWSFKFYMSSHKIWKRYIVRLFHKYDLYQYEKWLDKFYVPDMMMLKYINSDKLKGISAPLPPGSENVVVKHKDNINRDFSKRLLQIMYVGSIDSFRYRFAALIKAVTHTDNCILTLCCPEENWEKNKKEIEQYMCERICIIHKGMEDLKPYYESADICSLVFENSEYMDMAVPYKSFEYLAHEVPVIATQNTVIGQFVEKNNTGWVIPYDEYELCNLLNEIIEHPWMLDEKRKCCCIAKQQNLWTQRAMTVEKDLLYKD